MSVPLIVVIGMHRSGTSMAAHMLQMLGADMAEASYAAPGNISGHWERPRLMDMNDSILGVFRRQWNAPTHVLKLPEGWLDDPRVQEARARAVDWLTPQLGVQRPFGFKDPRTTLLLPFWTQVFADLGAEPRYVFCVRDPAQVARSLQARDAMDRGQAEYRWLMYNAEAVHAVPDLPVCILPYESWFTHAPETALRLARHARLPEPSQAGVQAVVDAGLRHDDIAISPAAPLAARLHRMLVEDENSSRFSSAAHELASLIRDFRAQIQPLLIDVEVIRTGLIEQRRVIGDLQSLVKRLRD